MALWAPEYSMQPQQPFGRRAPTQRETPPPAKPKLARAEELGPTPPRIDELRPAALHAMEPHPAPGNLLHGDADPDADIDRELADYRTMRKIRKRSFREPWRSFCIAATLGIGLSSWLLPDSVANVAEWVTTGLAIASFAAGYRKR
jgi:hypothetical protein